MQIHMGGAFHGIFETFQKQYGKEMNSTMIVQYVLVVPIEKEKKKREDEERCELMIGEGTKYQHV